MFGRVAGHSIAGFLVCLLAVVGSPAAAHAQWQVDMAAIGPAEPPRTSPIATEPFGLSAVPITSGEVVAKWNGVAADIRAERDILARCRDDGGRCPAPAQKFLAVIAEGRAHSGRARFGVVNRAINLAIRPTSDLAQWGVSDRWSAPLATFTTGRGDCEDYAIAKYVALREAGVAEDDLRLVIVRDLAAGEDHAIVAARLDGVWITLDNRWLALVEDIDLRRVAPLFVFDGDGVKQFAPAVAALSAAPATLGP